MGKRHLIIGDSHAHPDFNNERFTWLGKLIHDSRPDVVVNIGDMADMASLCAHSKAIEISTLPSFIPVSSVISFAPVRAAISARFFTVC